jgi:hypothetical protein
MSSITTVLLKMSILVFCFLLVSNIFFALMTNKGLSSPIRNFQHTEELVGNQKHTEELVGNQQDYHTKGPIGTLKDLLVPIRTHMYAYEPISTHKYPSVPIRTHPYP